MFAGEQSSIGPPRPSGTKPCQTVRVVSTTNRAYGGQSADVRRRQRRERLLESAMDVMTRNEWRSVTVEKLCAAANLNKRYFYESFTDLDAVAAAVVDDIAGRRAQRHGGRGGRGRAEPLEIQAMASVSAAGAGHSSTIRVAARVLLGECRGVARARCPPHDGHRTGSPTCSSTTGAQSTGSSWKAIRWPR